ncbi:type II toxin-antitoxin system HicB family antitoxin [Peribacillus huizhouensis]|uniref:RNase H-like HicB family nuclease n=1 Tax=Peribacillus huizhouensis TaxID=1501239 RepID=A0ABR6CJ22_9BACI|nr:type II toxin-antitoxin system HicB family antitoxin [Peribacillus huizhouensis]MBA9025066.1 putative RNase H-like HicB family nuclease [Peribacillus huizhouensis]
MINSDKLVYPAFIQQDDEGIFCVYFPTLFPESRWDFPLTRGKTKLKAIKSAKKDLAYSLAGILYDNEELPEPIPNRGCSVHIIEKQQSMQKQPFHKRLTATPF